MKIKLFVIVLCAMLFSSVSYAASNFVDAGKEHWAYESISDLSAKKIINGYDDGTFRPSNTISRAELATILTKVIGDSITNESTITYADVDPTAWYAASVKQASLFLQLLPRDGIHYFEPNRAATREEITGAIVGILTVAEAVDNNKQKYLDRFTDKYEIDPYFRTFVGFAVEKGIISGYKDNTFKPTASVSRAEAAFIIWRAFDEGKKIVALSEPVVDQVIKPTEKSDNIIDSKKIMNAFDPIYEEAGSFADGLAPIKQNGKWGFINQKGKNVIQPVYDDVHYFSEGMAAVSRNGKWGFIDTTGKLIVPTQYSAVGNFSEGLAAVREDEEDWGYINKSGKVEIPYQFGGYVYWDSPGQFHEGLASILIDNKYGFIDKLGNIAIEPQFMTAPTKFSEGLAGGIRDFNLVYINQSGKTVIDTGSNGYFGKFSEGLAAVMKDGLWGYVDKEGKTVIDYQFTEASDFSEGITAVKREQSELYEYIDRTGQTIIQPKYTIAKDFSEGLALVTEDNLYYGYINKEGELLSEYKYGPKSGSFHEGYAYVHFLKDDKYGYISIK